MRHSISLECGVIHEYDCTYYNTSMRFDRKPLHNLSRTIKTDAHPPAVCVRFENIKLKSMRDFHRYCRVVYRAMRKKYGKEKVQDECLRVFKVLFPLLHKARTTGEYGFSDEDRKRIRMIFESWNVKESSELDILLGNILNRMECSFTKEEFIEFCEDILVVVMRIRKLTNVECFRLMGVEDKDIKTILNSGISKSAAYKLAGNSIVCDVLFHIFRKLFIEPEPDMVKGGTIQLQLF